MLYIMEKKTNSTEKLLEQVIYRLNDILQNQLSSDYQSRAIIKHEEQLEEIKEAINKQTEALEKQSEILNTLKSCIIPVIFILCFLVSLIVYYIRTKL